MMSPELHGRVGLLAANPSQVLKLCTPDNEEAVSALSQEQRILAILDRHTYSTSHISTGLLNGVSVSSIIPMGPCGCTTSFRLRPVLPLISECVRWCHQAVITFAYIHSKGTVHNDISACNALLSSSMEIKVCDFGFVNVVGEKLMDGPETRYSRGNALSEIYSCVKDDLFGIGSLFYEILIGSRPYDLEDASRTRKLFDTHAFYRGGSAGGLQ
jgi:serine/threonine protein kinase